MLEATPLPCTIADAHKVAVLTSADAREVAALASAAAADVPLPDNMFLALLRSESFHDGFSI